jgi:hypothetical protein
MGMEFCRFWINSLELTVFCDRANWNFLVGFDAKKSMEDDERSVWISGAADFFAKCDLQNLV